MLWSAFLCDDAEAVQVTVATGNVERRVSIVVHQRGVTAGHQEVETHLRLFCYYRQVERSLERDRYFSNVMMADAGGGGVLRAVLCIPVSGHSVC